MYALILKANLITRLVVILVGLSLPVTVYSQLVIKSTERANLGSSKSIALDNVSATSLEFLQKNSRVLASVASNEKVIEVIGEDILTVTLSLEDKITKLKKYRVAGNGVVEEKMIQFPLGNFAEVFKDGSFIVVDLEEGGGKAIQFYSSNFQALSKYTPFQEGYTGVQVHVKDDLVLIGSKSINGGNPKLALFNNKAKQIFEQTIPTNGDISKVLCSRNLFAVYCFTQTTLRHEILIYNRSGQLLWKRDIELMVNKWEFNELSSHLLIGTIESVSLFNSVKGDILFGARLSNIYSENGIILSRPDKYVEILGIESLPDGNTVLLLAEPEGSERHKNIVLYSVNPRSNKIVKVINIGDGETRPLLKLKEHQIVIVKDNEIVKYEF